MKISIITAIHNGFEFNQIYMDSLKKYTYYDYELIIIDNASTDGSAELFRKNGAVIISNAKNYSYPYTQNQGIRAATGDYLFFLNNDIIVSPHWDKHLIDAANKNGVDILSAKSIDNMGSKSDTRKIDHQWKRTKYPLFFLIGVKKFNLLWMAKLMYGNWEKFCRKQWDTYGQSVAEGIAGSNVMFTRKALQIMGGWDESQQSADLDLFMRVKKRSAEVGDIKPCQIALGVFIHHYVRMTSKYYKVKPAPFADKDKLIPLEQKWTKEEYQKYNPGNAGSI